MRGLLLPHHRLGWFPYLGFVHQLNCPLCTDSDRVQTGQAIRKAQKYTIAGGGRMAARGSCTSSLAIGVRRRQFGFARERNMTLARFPDKVFGPQDIRAMSTALEDVCNILDLSDEARSERELLAQNILALAHHGERSAALLRDRMLREIAYGQGGWPAALVRSARCGAL